MRQWGRHLVLRTLGSIKKPAKRTHFLNGHYVFEQPKPIPYQLELLSKRLKQIKSLATIVTPEEAIEHRYQDKDVLICLSFDDGFRDCKDILAPVFATENVKALFFVNPKFFGKTGTEAKEIIKKQYLKNFNRAFLDEGDIIILSKDGHIIGSHTLSHARLSCLTLDEAKYQMDESARLIEAITNVPCRHFAYPFGTRLDITEEQLKYASSKFEFIFSSIKDKSMNFPDKSVINRRHYEPSDPVEYLRFFLS